MSLQQRISAHLASHVQRQTAMVTFVTSVGVLLAALLVGACLLVALVFFYGFGTDAFATRISPAAILNLKYAGALLGAVGVASLAGFILGSAMLIASLYHARYRAAYLWFAIAIGLLGAAVFFRVLSY